MDCDDPILFRARKVCATIYPQDTMRYFRGELDETEPMRVAYLAFNKGREYGHREKEDGEC